MGIAIIFITLCGLVFLGVPVAFSIGLTALVNLMIRGDLPLTIMVQRMVNGLDSFPFLAIPLFILAGQLMNRTGLTDRIFDFALGIVGHIKGSLAHVNVIASIIFAGISGVAQADAAGLGMIEIQAMRKAGYRLDYAAAVTATSSIVGPIIPPSVIMAVFSVISSISLARLFLAGFIPGLIMGLCLMGLIYFLAATGRQTGTVYKRQSMRAIMKKFLRAAPALLTPVILVAGMLLGAATPTELGAICVVYGLILALFYGNLTFRTLIKVFEETLIMVGILVFVIAASCDFAHYGPCVIPAHAKPGSGSGALRIDCCHQPAHWGSDPTFWYVPIYCPGNHRRPVHRCREEDNSFSYPIVGDSLAGDLCPSDIAISAQAVIQIDRTLIERSAN
jgi:tripartite ATP-independent transporter DctM subunit